jgi:prepilin-type N-terminal cleavage/methylation domain-containing protein/prepilin-type processing-associated H-X9-DG protein
MNTKHSKCRWSRGSSRAFTLVELLVVIAIIALLLSILMPALKKVRERGMSIQCATKERQIGLAMLTYSEDFGGSMPFALYYTPPSGPWVLAIPHGVIRGYYNTNLGPWLGKPGTKWTTNNTVFLCPAQLSEPNFVAHYKIPETQRLMWSSYAYNYNIGYGKDATGTPLVPSRKTSQVKPTTILLIDSWPGSSFVCGKNSGYGEGKPRTWPWAGAFRHYGGMNVLFADNHSERRLPNDAAMNDPQGHIWGN